MVIVACILYIDITNRYVLNFSLIFVLFRKMLYLDFPYLKGKMKYLTILAVLILIILQVIIFMFNPDLK